MLCEHWCRGGPLPAEDCPVPQWGWVLLSHSSSFPGAHCLLTCSCSICANYFSGFSHLVSAKMAELFHPVLFPGVFLVFLLFPPGFCVQLALLTTSCSPGTCSCPHNRWAEAPPQHASSPCERLFLCLPFSYRKGGSAEGEAFGICYFIRINSQVGCYFPFQLREVVVAAF